MNCLICYQPLDETGQRIHPACSKKWFGSETPPELPYALDDLNDLAKEVVQSHVTVPGVQAKLSLHLQQSRKAESRFTLVGLWGNYILKPPVEEYPEMPEVEDLSMHLAGLFGIETVPHCLIPLKSGELAYLTRRIDRNRAGKSIHMEDMCQLTERLTEHKYRASMEQVGKVVLKYASNPLFDVIRFVEVTLFSFLMGNADMHLKNFSLIYNSSDMIRLSPAYDLLSTRLLIPVEKDSEELALTLCGKKSNFNRTDFITFAEYLNLNSKQIENIWKRFTKAIPQMGGWIDRSFLSDEQKEAYKQLVGERTERFLVD